MISTRNLGLLPDVAVLRAAYQAMAMLDAIIQPEWENRYFSFSGEPTEDGISVGSMRNGSGDDVHAIFGLAGCLLRGFAHEHEMSPYAQHPKCVFPGVLEDVPDEFADCRAALHMDWWQAITFCIWRRHSDSKWHHGKINFPDSSDPDGSADLLAAYDGRPETYHRWAEEYYQPRRFKLAAVRSVFEHRPLTKKIIRDLNPRRLLSDLHEEIRQIGY